MIPYAEWSSRLLIALFRYNCVLAFIARVEQLPIPSVQMEDEHWAYAQRAKDIPHNSIFKHINGEAFCAGKTENCLFVWSSTPVAHLFGSDPNKWCDGAWANRLWIRTCDTVCLPACPPTSLCVYLCVRACIPRPLSHFYLSIPLCTSFSFGPLFSFLGKFFSRFMFFILRSSMNDGARTHSIATRRTSHARIHKRTQFAWCEPNL